MQNSFAYQLHIRNMLFKIPNGHIMLTFDSVIFLYFQNKIDFHFLSLYYKSEKMRIINLRQGIYFFCNEKE